MAGTTELREVTTSQGASLRVDRVNGVIRGVRLLGEKSANPPPFNHVYPRATREAARPLLEGAKVNVDHGPRGQGEPRSVRDSVGMGYVKNVRETGSGL